MNQWDEISDHYDGIAGGEQDGVYRILKEHIWSSLGDLAGVTVLDLGCGSGWLAAHMSKKGAQVIGVDGSERLIELARSRDPSLRWLHHDLRLGLPDAIAFDLVVSHMVLMDFDPVIPVVSDLARQMTAGQRVVVTLPHPAFFNYPTEGDGSGSYRKVRNYLKFEEWEIDTFGRHTHFHRPLSFYVQVFSDNGFLLNKLVEPNHKDHTPVFCLLVLVRGAF